MSVKFQDFFERVSANELSPSFQIIYTGLNLIRTLHYQIIQ